MPEIKNTFLKSKMNKDLDDRLIPNGEYRDAQNLQISRSEGSSVGEFENIPGNIQRAYLNTGKNGTSYTAKVIGQYTDEANATIYMMSAGYSGDSVCPRDIVVYGGASLQAASTITLWTEGPGGTQLNPQELGIEVGMVFQQESTGGGYTIDPIVLSMTTTTITLSQSVTIAGGGLSGPGDTLTIGWANTIHSYNTNTQVLTLLVRGGFLNFHQDYKILGTNLVEGLLFWTDNRNQPRRIDVDAALANGISYYTNEDQISVAKYYPYETPLVLNQNILNAISGQLASARAAGLIGYDLTMTAITGIEVGDIVTGFTNQGAQELWEVIGITGTVVTIYNNFIMSPTSAPSNTLLTFSRPSMTSVSPIKCNNGFVTTIDSTMSAGAKAAGSDITIDYKYNNASAATAGPQPTPNVGDLIISTAMSLTVANDVRIQNIKTITPGTSMVIQLTHAVTVVSPGNDDITISANPDYDSNFTGDPDLIEEKFVRFSYRFKFVNNEYSLSAPFTQIAFIPKQHGIFGDGPNESTQDMTNAYASSIVAWMENNIDSVALKIPLPLGGATAAAAITSLIDDYQVSEIEILYKAADQINIKILESISINDGISSYITALPSTSTTEWYYTFDYKSIKPYKTLPTSQNTRVYDKTPIKALAQELIGNRITYGNFVENHTPPPPIDYEVILADKSLAYDNYAQYPNHSIKQNRNYQVGFILSDRYGRQSSVVLSKNDDTPNTAGSTIYVPYKTWDDVDIDNGLSTYEWLGNVLRIKVNNGITQTTKNEQTGEPGLYKAYSDTEVDAFSITTAGTGYTVGDACTTAAIGLGSGFAFTVESITGGGATGPIGGITITNRGSGYVDGAELTVAGGTGSSAKITITVNPPNVLGWQSYKFAVKQQEQEYYNTYLPGFINGYPVTQNIDRGRVAFACVLSDNINKIPRDLNEVGPLQTEFSSSVLLYGRVNNPPINNKGAAGEYWDTREDPWNAQYFPGRIPDEVVAVGPAGQSGLELATGFFITGVAAAAFDEASGANPWGTTGAVSSLYNQQQNPLVAAIKVGSQESQPNLDPNVITTLGAQVTAVTTGSAIRCMQPYLSVSETAPVESLLEIFWETSTSGNFITLNREVTVDYAGVSLVSDSTGNVDEDYAIGTAVMSGLNFLDSAGNILTLDEIPTITSVIASTDPPTDVTSGTALFILENDPAGVAKKDFRIKTNQLFWYGAATATKPLTWTLSFQTSYSTGTYIDELNNVITITLNNEAPDTLAFNSATEGAKTCGASTSGFDTNATVFGTFSGKNGSADTANDQQELCWTIAETAKPAGSTAVWSIDQSGVVSKTGTILNGTYTLEATLTDAADSCTSSTGSLSTTCDIDIVIGTPDTDQAICFEDYAAWYSSNDTSCYTGTGKPLEVFFGASQYIANTTTTATTGSKTDAFLSSDIEGTPGVSVGAYTNYSNLGVRYYNVKAIANASLGTACIPARTFTTGALTQGVMAIKVNLVKAVTASSADFSTNYTILYRTSAASNWELAQPCASCGGAAVNSPTSPGGTVGNHNLMEVSGAGSATASTTYYFDTPGEYVVRNTRVHGPGCTSFAGNCTFKVEYWDVTTGSGGSACTACTGPL